MGCSMNATLQNMESIKQKWQSGISTLNGWISLNNHFAAEIMSHAEFDTLTIDMQHGVSDYSTLVSQLQGILGRGTPVFARIPWLEAGILMKTLDSGVNGLICPMINTGEEARQLAKWSKYPPKGERSFGPIRAKFVWEGDYYSVANDEVLIFAMIETARAMENIDDILSTDGISGIYIGPADLSSSLGVKPQFDQEDSKVSDAIAFILQKAKSYKKIAGIHNQTPAYAKKMGDLGFDFLTLGSDAFYMLDGAKRAISTFRNL